MAVWQFVIDFVPKQFLLNTYGRIPEAISLEDRKRGDFFRKTSYTIVELLPYLQPFGSFDKDSWSGTRFYRGEGDNDAAIYFDEATSQVAEISCRIDVRQPYEDFLCGILALAVAFDCQLLARGSRQFFAPTTSALFLAVEQSTAARFVADPLKFLRDLSEAKPSESPPD